MIIDRVEKLGRYFVTYNVRRRTGLSFEEFVKMVDRGDWDANIMKPSNAQYRVNLAIEGTKSNRKVTKIG